MPTQLKNTVINLVRHAEVRNPGNIFYGRSLGFPITEHGAAQVERSAVFFKEKSIAACYISPMLRTQQTAKVLAKDKKDLSMVLEPDLNEIYSPFDGENFEELSKKKHGDIYNGVPLPYEQPQDILNRGLKFFKGVQLGNDGEEIIAVTHADVIAFMRLYFEGYPVLSKNKQLVQKAAHASITRFCFETGPNGALLSLEYIDANK